MAYVYVASSWKNDVYSDVIKLLEAEGIDHYDFRKEGFHWHEAGVRAEPTFTEYMRGLNHVRADEGFERDFQAMQIATHGILVLPCGRSAHLEAGWLIAHGAKVCIYIPWRATEPIVPELMYKMADAIVDTQAGILGWFYG